MLHELRAELPPAVGRHGLVQGGYGSGNLELVAPDPDTGFWVFWYNADVPGSPEAPGALPRCWSGGLHVAGPPLVSAVITQMTAGPQFLEVVGYDGVTAHRFCWRPDGGFSWLGPLAADVRSCSALAESREGGSVHALAVDDSGDLLRLAASLASYPDLAWERVAVEGPVAASDVALLQDGGAVRAAVTTPSAVLLLSSTDGRVWQSDVDLPGRWRSVSLVAGAVVALDADGVVTVLQPGGARRWWPSRHWDEVAAARSTLDGGRLEVVARAGHGLWHGWEARPPVRIESRVLVTDPSLPVHRG